jgi:hypothetical protein
MNQTPADWPGDLLPPAVLAFFEYEAVADGVEQFEPELIPGLLQTREYAGVVLAQVEGARTDDVGRLVDARLRRQQALPRLALAWIVGEAAVRQVIGGPTVMRAQLLHIRELAVRPNITFQILPLGLGAHGGLFGAFIHLDVDGRSVIYLEGRVHTLVYPDEERSEYFRGLFQQLRAIALTAAASDALLTQIIEALPAG